MALTRLRIENFAIIESLEIDFLPGLTIITGETGAGKSIIIDALNLALGEKANVNLIRAGADSAQVECEFTLAETKQWIEFFSQKGLELKGNRLTLRREVSNSGRSRAWVNGFSCALNTLKEIGNRLVDLHGQHSHQSLLDESTHIQFLDSFGDYEPLLQKVAQLYDQVESVAAKSAVLKERLQLLREKRELWAFQLEEIQKVNPQPGEYEELLEEKVLLENAERVHLLIRELHEGLLEGEHSLYNQLLLVIKNFGQLGRLTNRFQNEVNQLTEQQYFYQELARSLASLSASVQFNPVRLEAVNQRLFQLQQLMKKHGPDIQTVFEKKNELLQNLNQEDDLQLQIEATERRLKMLIESYLTAAQELTLKRREQAQQFEAGLQQVLQRLGIRGATFKVQIEKVSEPGSWARIDGQPYRAERTGLDRVVFEISTNAGEPLRPLAAIVSGGEVSRIMLGIKSLLAGRDQIPVIIFDEIDSGISGSVARIVGEELRSLARVHQVICITHLPQIASLADDHFYVKKVNVDGRVRTTVKRLDAEERVNAVAELLGGKTVTEVARQQARELIQ